MATILHTLVAVALCAVSYFAGLHTAGHYHRQQSLAVDNALERQRMDLRANVTPLSPATPYLAPMGKHTKEAFR